VSSNFPGIDWQSSATSQPGLVLLSSTLTEEAFPGSIFDSFYGEAVNRGSSVVCDVHIKIDLTDDSGQTLLALESYADGPAYKSSGTVSSDCLAPGEHGAFWDIQQGTTRVPFAYITHASVTIDSFAPENAVPHPLAPTTVSSTVIPRFNGYAVSGTVQASAGTIYNLGMTVYTRGASGRLSDRVSDTHLDTLAQGGSWSYETSANTGEPVARYLQFVGFIEGPRPASLVAAPLDARALARRHVAERQAGLRAVLDAHRADRR
jgi:hypothetical protein